MNLVRVRKRPDRRFLQLAFTDPLTGLVKTKSAGTSNWKAAERAAAKWELEISHGQGTATNWEWFRVRFEDEYLTAKPYATSKEYLGTLNKFENIVGSVKSVNLITASVCSKFMAGLRRQGISEATTAKHLRQLSVALNWAESMGMIESAPKIRKPKLPKRNMRGRSLTLMEFKRFLTAAESYLPCNIAYYWVDFLKTIWLTGLRIGEALDLHHTRPPIQLDLASRNPRLIFRAEGQKNATDDLVPLTPDAIRFLRSLPHCDGYVLPLPGERVPRVSIGTAIRTIVEIGEYSEICTGTNKFVSSHDLRRTFGTRWALRVHPIALKVMMRHSDLKTTLRYYVDLDCDAIADQIVHGHVHGTRF
jgi:integrase